MYKRMKKGLAFLFAVIFLLTGMPLPAQGAATPAFSKTYLTMYENGKGQGVYKLKVKNVKKGYITRWSVSKAGKRYASFDTNRVVAKSKTVTNTLTINSYEESAFSAGLPVCIKVKVYNANKALISQLSFTPTLHRQAESIQLDTSKIDNLEQLSVGTKYQFNAAMSPANTTSKLCWQVTDASGKDHSKEITSKGVWTPTEEGKYTVTAYAVRKVSKAKLCPTSVEVTVGCHINTVSQSSANGIRITFGSDVSKRYKDSDFTVKSGESILPVKSLKFSEDGKTAELTTTQNFMNGVTYIVSCNGSEKEFKASMGDPVELAIVTTSVQCEKFTTIKYKLLDENGIDVTDNADGTFSYSKNITNGYLDNGRVYMNVVGDTGTITMTYTSKDGKIRLTDTKQIVCVEATAEQAVTTHFTLTNSAQAPLFNSADVRTITIGDTMYAHFQGLDIDNNVISYDSVTYQSSDPDKLIISSDGKITPIKPGNIMVVATAKQGNDSVTYPYSITVREAKYLTSLQMERTYITMSNLVDSDYCVRIPVSAFDQYGNKYTLSNETWNIPLSIDSPVNAVYNPATNCVEIKNVTESASRVHNFTLTVTENNRSVSQNFSVYITTVPTSGTVTYQVEATPSSVDLSIDENTTANSFDTDVRLARYRGGVFAGYLPLTKATIRKNNQYYDQNLNRVTQELDIIHPTTASSSVATSPSSINNKVTVHPITLNYGAGSNTLGTCVKSETGAYQITLVGTDTKSNNGTQSVSQVGTINITDRQETPAYNLRSLTPDRTASNALDLVRSCIQLPDGGNILNCTVTGSTQSGGNYVLHSGEMVHIDKVKVQSVVTIANGERIYVESDILIDKTFTNK